jgi:hypothetical protein
MIGTVFKEHKTKLFVLIMAFISMLLMPLAIPDLHSLSKSWLTPWQAMFIFSNAATSYYMYSSHRWKLPGLFLMLATAFSVEWHRELHYAFAVLFFLGCIRPLALDKRLNAYAVPYVLTLPLFIWDILVAEMAAIVVLLAYHANLLYLAWSINRKRKAL